jgi:PAT family beta-lactamase induction signal transducer AmpG
LEAFKTKRFFVVATELAIAFGLAAISATLGARTLAPCLLLLASVAIAAATHDMAADGLYIGALDEEGRARYVGWISVAFNVAKFVVQGVLVVGVGVLESRGGVLTAWRSAFLVLAAIAAALALYHARVLPRDEPETQASPTDTRSTWTRVVSSFLERPKIGWLVLLIVFYRFAEGQTVRIVPLFLLDPPARGGIGLSTSEIGIFYGALGAVAYMCGSLAGGAISSRFGLARALVPLSILFNAPAAIYGLFAWTRPESRGLVAAAVVADQISYGIGFIGLKLVMMESLATGRHRTAHFAFATSLSGFAATLAGMLSGSIQAFVGYRAFFVWALVAAVPGIAASYLCVRGFGLWPSSTRFEGEAVARGARVK